MGRRLMQRTILARPYRKGRRWARRVLGVSMMSKSDTLPGKSGGDFRDLRLRRARDYPKRLALKRSGWLTKNTLGACNNETDSVTGWGLSTMSVRGRNGFCMNHLALSRGNAQAMLTL
jgi:hypothetical protein